MSLSILSAPRGGGVVSVRCCFTEILFIPNS
jgi:hypothetical protein